MNILLPRLALLCCLSLLLQNFASAADMPAMIEKIKPSVVAVGSLQQTRTPPVMFRGTGFAVADGMHIITNAHVLPPVLDTENKEVLGIMTGKGETARFREARIVSLDREHDLALLKINGEAVPPLKLSNSDGLREGDNVAITGFPLGAMLGLYPVTHRAMVSCITPIVIPAATSKQLDAKVIKRVRTPFSVFQLDGTVYPGNSGSPMYDPETGGVYGIINMTFIKSTKENALSDPSGISYAIPGNYIRELLAQAGLKP